MPLLAKIRVKTSEKGPHRLDANCTSLETITRRSDERKRETMLNVVKLERVFTKTTSKKEVISTMTVRRLPTPKCENAAAFANPLERRITQSEQKDHSERSDQTEPSHRSVKSAVPYRHSRRYAPAIIRRINIHHRLMLMLVRGRGYDQPSHDTAGTAARPHACAPRPCRA